MELWFTNRILRTQPSTNWVSHTHCLSLKLCWKWIVLLFSKPSYTVSNGAVVEFLNFGNKQPPMASEVTPDLKSKLPGLDYICDQSLKIFLLAKKWLNLEEENHEWSTYWLSLLSHESKNGKYFRRNCLAIWTSRSRFFIGWVFRQEISIL